MSYAQRYHSVLETGDPTPLVSLQSAAVLRHVLEALANLSKFQGRYDIWLAILQRYNLKWSSGNESLQSFERFFNDDLNYDVMLQRIRELIRKLPAEYANYIRYTYLSRVTPDRYVTFDNERKRG
jgi:hypothetical protein